MSKINDLRLAPLWATEEDYEALETSSMPPVDEVDGKLDEVPEGVGSHLRASGDELPASKSASTKQLSASASRSASTDRLAASASRSASTDRLAASASRSGSTDRLSTSGDPTDRTSFFEKIGDLVFLGADDQTETGDDMSASSLHGVDFTLHQAASEGATNILKEQIRQLALGGDKFLEEEVNKPNKKGYTPLHLAAMYNRKNCIIQLLENKAVIDVTGGADDVTPLHLAAMYKMVAAGRCLIEKNADVNIKNNYGSGALYFAARSGSHVLVEELLNKGADPKDKDNALSTPLHAAMMSGSEKVTILLLKHGADIQAVDNEGEMSIHFAAAEDNAALIKLLADAVIKDVDDDHKDEVLKDFINCTTMENDTALHIASQSGYIDTVKVLMELQADVNARTDTNAAPLHLAAIGGHTDIAEYLIASGAKVTASDADGTHPLHKACQYGHIDVIKLLHQHKGRIDTQDRDNFTPLMYAVWKGHTEAVKYLLANKAKLHLEDVNGKCVLHLAVEEDQIEMLDLLLEIEGIEPFIDNNDKDFKTPLHYAAKHGNSDAVRSLLGKNAELDNGDNEEMTALHIAAKEGHAEIVRILGEASPGIINATDDKGRSALHLAAISGHREVTHSLIEMGSEISCRDEVNWTPLDYAARNGFHKTMIILIENDAVVDAADKNKMTPLHLASEYGHTNCIKVLLDYDATISMLNKDDKNCLELAIENFKEEACMAILEHRRWLEALKHIDANGTPVIDKLIKALPDVAEYVLNKSMETSSFPVKHPDYYVKYNFEVLDSHPDAVEHSTYFGPASMVRYKRYNLLSHPLTVRLINDKWQRLGQWLYLPTLLLYMLFVALVTSLLVIDKQRNAAGKKANVTMGMSDTRFDKSTEQKVIPWLILFLAIVQLIKECVQMYFLRARYFKDKENYLELTMYALCIAFAVPFIIEALDKNELNHNPFGVLRISPTTMKYYVKLESIKWNIGALVVLAAWGNLLFYLKRLPTFGIHVIMFSEVSKTLIHVIFTFFFLIMAFAFSFYILLDNMEAFKHPGRAILKTGVMTIGEFEFSGIFVSNYMSTKMLPYKVVTFIIFFVFLIVMPILFMNLLVGLAVGDIEAVRKQAVVVILKNLVHVLKSMSNTYPQWFLRRRYRSTVTDYPNKMKWYLRILTKLGSQDTDLQKDMDEENRTQMMNDLKQNRLELEKQKRHMKNMYDVLEEHHELSQKIFEHYKNQLAVAGAVQSFTTKL